MANAGKKWSTMDDFDLLDHLARRSMADTADFLCRGIKECKRRVEKLKQDGIITPEQVEAHAKRKKRPPRR